MPYCATRPTLARTASRTSSTTSTRASWFVWPRGTTIHSAPHANRHRGGASRRTCSRVELLHGQSWNAGLEKEISPISKSNWTYPLFWFLSPFLVPDPQSDRWTFTSLLMWLRRECQVKGSFSAGYAVRRALCTPLVMVHGSRHRVAV